MPSTQVRDVLDHIRSYHHRLSGFYGDLSGTVTDERVRILLRDMAKREQDIDDVLADYEAEASPLILNTWIQFAADASLEEVFDETFDEGISPEEIVRFATDHDRKLIDFYRDMVGSTAAEDVQQLFTNLVANEERKDHEYGRFLQGIDGQ